MTQEAGDPGGPPFEGDGVPRCYRHPERESHIRCTRCERPICPACMIAASVGFQCPECVRDGAARQPRTLAGAAMSRPGRSVAAGIIAFNVAVFLLQQQPALQVTGRFEMFGLAVASGEWYRMLTSAFLHAGVAHIAFNMYALYVLGVSLEGVLGRWRFAVLYLLSGLGGSLAFYLMVRPDAAAVGASGAIFGLFGAHLVVARRLKRDASGLYVLIAINAVFGFLAPGIAWQAHLGGFVTGIVVAVGLVYAPQQRRLAVQVGCCLAVLAVIIAGTTLRTDQLRARYLGAGLPTMGISHVDNYVAVIPDGESG